MTAVVLTLAMWILGRRAATEQKKGMVFPPREKTAMASQRERDEFGGKTKWQFFEDDEIKSDRSIYKADLKFSFNFFSNLR